MLVFMVIMFAALQKQQDAYDLQIFLDAKSVAGSVADNINMIAKNGDGYYRHFSVPESLYGFTEYDVTVSGNFLEISYAGSNWAAPLITDNVSIVRLEKGENKDNCVSNYGELIVINSVCAP